MDLFNFICGICSIGGFLVSLFTAGKVYKISKTYNLDNHDSHSKVENKGKNNIHVGSYVGRDSINESGSKK